MMTAEFMLSKRPVLRFTAALFFLLKHNVIVNLPQFLTLQLNILLYFKPERAKLIMIKQLVTIQIIEASQLIG